MQQLFESRGVCPRFSRQTLHLNHSTNQDRACTIPIVQINATCTFTLHIDGKTARDLPARLEWWRPVPSNSPIKSYKLNWKQPPRLRYQLHYVVCTRHLVQRFESPHWLNDKTHQHLCTWPTRAHTSSNKRCGGILKIHLNPQMHTTDTKRFCSILQTWRDTSPYIAVNKDTDLCQDQATEHHMSKWLINNLRCILFDMPIFWNWTSTTPPTDFS